MNTADTVRRFLEAQQVNFSTLSSPWDAQGRWQGGVNAIPHAAVARPFLLKDEQGVLMAVVPVTGRLDLAGLNRQLQRQLKVLAKNDYPPVFAHNESFILPALGAMAQLETVIDNSLLGQAMVYIASGRHDELICLGAADFRRVNSQARAADVLAHATGKPPASATASTQAAALTARRDIRERIRRTTELPPMPSLAQKIIQLNTNPYAHAEDLAKLVENDPSLSAQIIRYAQSSFYGYQGTVASVRQAVSRVLGYDVVMNIALGFAVARPFRIPQQGPLGLRAFWRSAIYCATLCESLSKLMPKDTLMQPGTAYLSGLLHNFGFLILGHVFPQEFELLHHTVQRDTQTPWLEIEQKLLNTTHMEMGAWLMTEWNMPQEVIVAQQEHHNPAYTGPYASYARLVCLSNHLLFDYDLGDAQGSELPAGLLEGLGLRGAQVSKLVENVMGSAKNLDLLARKLAA